MNRSPKNIANRTRGRVASWHNYSESIEPIIERVLNWFERLGYTVLLQSDIISGRHQAILQNYRNGILSDRFRLAMERINPTISPQLNSRSL